MQGKPHFFRLHCDSHTNSGSMTWTRSSELNPRNVMCHTHHNSAATPCNILFSCCDAFATFSAWLSPPAKKKQNELQYSKFSVFRRLRLIFLQSGTKTDPFYRILEQGPPFSRVVGANCTRLKGFYSFEMLLDQGSNHWFWPTVLVHIKANEKHQAAVQNTQCQRMPSRPKSPPPPLAVKAPPPLKC